MRFTRGVFALLALPLLAHAGPLPALQPYLETNGRIAAEAEHYHAIATNQGDRWTFVTADSPGAFTNVRAAGYLQTLPDDGPATMSFSGTNAGASVDYFLAIQTPGTYRLWLRWDGYHAAADSLFAGLLESADGAGGVPDWYEDTDHADANFATDAWDGLGGSEENVPTASQNPMTWSIATAGVYTLRVAAREDGVALDAWVLQLDSLPAPSGESFPIAAPDAITLHHASKAGIPVLRNDGGAIHTSSVEIVAAPSFGTATPRSDGAIVYAHTNGAPAADAFTYRFSNGAGATSTPATVALNFSIALRLPNTTVAMPVAPPPSTYQVVDAFPGVTFNTPTSMESPPGDTSRLFVAERGGRIHVITNVSAAMPTKQLFLDISSRVQDDGNELGMKGIAFHPGYATNRYFFVTYCHLSNATRYVRLSRFQTQAGNPHAADTNSELMLINQRNDNTIHNIDDAVFGPDGYLYIGIGDEGPQDDGGNNSQRIDKDIWSAVLRIDVDNLPGSLAPTPHSGIATNPSGQAFFSIPPDNPFVGATQFNGSAVTTANVRTEFYAVGFRNPWQFSFDPLNGEMWLGDVGNNAWEEVNVVTAGANHGWAYFEGTHSGPKSPPPGFTYVRPVWEYPHGGGEFAGYSITAGLVYRGPHYTALNGLFVCSDYVSGNIWTIERGPGVTNVTRIAGEGGLVQFGLDPATREILMVDHGDGRIRRLTEQTTDSVFPQTLSETGFFADLADLAPNPGVVAYEPNMAFWSDHAIKRRWFVITNTTDQVGYARETPWSFPTGMMWVKHFDLELTRGAPESRKRIETRVIVRNAAGAYGVSYHWNTAQTEAFLVPDAGTNFTLSITNSGQPGTQPWEIPSRAECIVCHTPFAGHALSFTTRQLNRDGAIAGQPGNFLDLLDQAGYVSNAVDPHATLPRHVRPDETEFSLEARARSYLAVNCSYCHQAGSGSAPGSWDGRPSLTLSATHLIHGEAGNNGGNTNNLLVVPGDTAHSIVYNRVAATNGFTRMPPLATSELDATNIQLLASWIDAELPGWQDYDAWRLARFGSTNSPDGARDADPDEDTSSNWDEFLTRSDPTNGLDAWPGGVIAPSGDDVSVSHDLYNRRVTVETSSNLVSWVQWIASGNNGLPLASGAVQSVIAPAPGPEGFFRFRVEEP
jgi:glucose/arabinose dehydrogenase